MRFTQQQVIASLCKQSFEDFCREFWHTVVPEPVVWNWHMSVICEELQVVAERIFLNQPKLYDLVINVSPASSKSTLCSIMFPAWCWTRMPHFKFIGASYAYPLALDLSRKNRDVVKSELYQECFPYVHIREDQDTKGYFVNTKYGQRFTTGSLGSVMGMHGHAIIIDDPLDPNRAVSEAELFQVNNWIKETLSGRKTDKRLTPTILIMQRLHQDDPTALFLKKKRVRHICIPSEITDDINPPELRQYYEDQVMDNKRLPWDVLKEVEDELGPYAYAGQYLQSPRPRAGGMFDVSKIRLGKPSILKRVVRYWDKAGTPDKVKRGRGAYTVGAKLGLDDANRVFILDIIRVRMDSYDREKLIFDTAYNDGRATSIGVEQEGGSGGKESAEGTVRRLLGFHVKLDRPGTDKETRADPFSVQVNAGNVFMVPGAWNDEFIKEIQFFPFSSTKDQVDASSGAFAMLAIPRRRIGALRPRDYAGSEDSDDRKRIMIMRVLGR